MTEIKLQHEQGQQSLSKEDSHIHLEENGWRPLLKVRSHLASLTWRLQKHTNHCLLQCLLSSCSLFPSFYSFLIPSLFPSFLPLSSASPFSNEKPESYSYQFPLVRSFVLILLSLYLNINAPSHFIHLPCRWRQQVTPKCWYLSTRQHCISILITVVMSSLGQMHKLKYHTSINSSKCWLPCRSDKAFRMWKPIAFLPNAAKILLMRYHSHMTNTSTHLYFSFLYVQKHLLVLW